ncbi:26S proteasome non-ATPase regulatory subunit 11 [Histomonas meleagridis]|uniref:26S proteasome non-ATPase regulatory subunit 11-like n=1 Tax=Histomonas meleagridis TaxID=135588 RepID=UPI0035599A2A|nr:26S proteasome non-ATPase regulatory subunit 11 [Histomonas meleagridis]KAH0801703.1 26S proteasome non-ATPase regulatory subunit 11-like [Histomonas meleagridis]
MDPEEFTQQLDEIMALRSQDEVNCAAKLEDLIDLITKDTEHIEDVAGVFEKVLVSLLSIYVSLGDGSKYSQLLAHLQPYFIQIPKARTAKLVRLIIQSLRKVPDTRDLQISLCQEWIQWSIKEERTLLRQRLEIELSEILLEDKRYNETLEIISRLTTELRKVDHKSQLIEVYLIESRTFRGLGDYSRAKASLTAARTNAAAVYTSPLLQGQLDLESGIIFTEEKDYRTASSYFSEAFDAFSSANDPRATDALKYNLLCKILDDRPNECFSIYQNSALTLTHLHSTSGDDSNAKNEIEAMLEIGKASEAKSLKQLTEIMERRHNDLENDPVVASNIHNLIDSLEEQNLLRIVKPYSAVELSRIAEMINLPVEEVEAKLVQMILDQKLKASINQSDGILNIFEDEEENELLTQSIELIEQMDGVVDALYARCKLIN